MFNLLYLIYWFYIVITEYFRVRKSGKLYYEDQYQQLFTARIEKQVQYNTGVTAK
jgi:hypothetical protein